MNNKIININNIHPRKEYTPKIVSQLLEEKKLVKEILLNTKLTLVDKMKIIKEFVEQEILSPKISHAQKILQLQRLFYDFELTVHKDNNINRVQARVAKIVIESNMAKKDIDHIFIGQDYLPAFYGKQRTF
ncbi:MAG: hypothetical protein KKA19_08285 [Candidatus Margulisbacteria bacterium]|nr:hypothetical protein [Candidatus Margulisiibacteriota bacterium]